MRPVISVNYPSPLVRFSFRRLEGTQNNPSHERDAIATAFKSVRNDHIQVDSA
ncbi:hypothetical protein QCA50_004660 [Cerrena zonata]|uniref:Uncharacterized protein n=1 Tax=Cerrena zonata TaxID=2478898 RepID=A0AAW0GFB4_9APHY